MKIWFDNFRHSRGVQGKSRDGHEVMHQPNPSHSLPSSIWTPSLRFSFIKWCLEAIMAPKPGNSHIFTHKWSCKFTDIIWNNIIFVKGLVWFPVNMNASVLYDFLSDSRRTKQPNVWNFRFLQKIRTSSNSRLPSQILLFLNENRIEKIFERSNATLHASFPPYYRFMRLWWPKLFSISPKRTFLWAPLTKYKGKNMLPTPYWSTIESW